MVTPTMRRRPKVCVFIASWMFFVVVGAVALLAQNRPAGSESARSVPHLVRFSAAIAGRTGITAVTFAVYDSETGGAPVWQETQNVSLDQAGAFTVTLGQTAVEGVPAWVFDGAERWLALRIDGRETSARVRILAVPYALRAATADTLGGLPVSAFVLANSNSPAADKATGSVRQEGAASGLTGAGTANYVAKFGAAGDVQNSQIVDTNVAVGIGTAAPLARLDVQTTSATNSTALATTAYILNSTADSAVNTSMTMSLVDMSTASNLSNQAMRVAFFRDQNATGGVAYFNAILTASAFLDGDSPFILRGLNVESPRVAPGKSLQQYEGIYIEGPRSSGTIAQRHALIAEPGSGTVGIGTISPSEQLEVVGNIKISGGALVFPDGSRQATAAVVTNFSGVSGAPFYAIQNAAGSPNPLTAPGIPAAVEGISTAPEDHAAGVSGRAQSPTGAGLFGINTAASDYAPGVIGVSETSPEGVGVYGEVDNVGGNATTTGVLGWVNSPAVGAAGLAGLSSSTFGDTTGVYGSVVSPDGYGVEGDSYATSGVSAGVAGFSDSDEGRGVLGVATSETGVTYGVRGVSQSQSGTGVAGVATTPLGTATGVSATVSSPFASAMVVTNTSGAGTLIAGRTNEGGPNVFRVDSNGKGYFNGGTSVGGADFAETFAVKADAVAYEPGDVMAIDATGSRRLVRSSSAYSRAVAGVYSTKPGVVAAPVAVANQPSDGIPLAVVGVVPCKVSAENGSITPGDLLVTSSQPGYAMKGTDASKMTGAIVGKALQPWSSGKGVIEILVTLQ